MVARRTSRSPSWFNADIEFEMVDWPHPAKSRGVEAMGEPGSPVECVVVRLALYWGTERAREAAAGRD